MNILYLGLNHGLTKFQVAALNRLGHHVRFFDPTDSIPKWPFRDRWIWHTGAFGLAWFVNSAVLSVVNEFNPDLVFVRQGEMLSAGLVKRLRRFSVPIINYVNDDPFGGRDGLRFRNFLKAIPYYDLIGVLRDVNIKEARALGARKVVRLWFSSDEIGHAPPDAINQGSKEMLVVSFVGTWMPERGSFLLHLARAGLPIAIWGDNWEKSPEWGELQTYFRGGNVEDPKSYGEIIATSAICIGLLSRGNRDLHTTRSLEIPAIGGLLLAERTKEHELLYDDWKEAVFWSTADECVQYCKLLLSNEQLRHEIKRNAPVRAKRNNLFNERVLGEFILANHHNYKIDSIAPQ